MSGERTETKMEIKNSMPAENLQYCNWQMMSPEIVEIADDRKSSIESREEGTAEVFVAVGRNDLDVIKWVLNHVVLPGTHLYLVHVFPPIAYIPTPVGKLSSSQLSKEQMQIYVREENNRRKNLLQKYINLCNDAKVAVDTMLVESNAVAQAILDLIPVVNITKLFMGIKCPPSIRLLRKGKSEYVQKNAPEYCEVTVIYDGKKVTDGSKQKAASAVPSALRAKPQKSKPAKLPERNFFECVCFSGKFN